MASRWWEIASEDQAVARPRAIRDLTDGCLREEGKPLHYTGAEKDDSSLVYAAKRYLESWDNALAGAASGAAWAVSGAYSLQNRRTQLVCPAAAFGIGGQFRSVDTGMPQRGLAC